MMYTRPADRRRSATPDDGAWGHLGAPLGSPGSAASAMSPPRSSSRATGGRSRRPRDAAGDDGSNFWVVIRVRPPVPRELNGYQPFLNVVQHDSERQLTLCEAVPWEDGRAAAVYAKQSFSFDHVYEAAAQQEEVYARSARPAVRSVLEGYNATLMAYGQTGAGKTYTMEGFTSEAQRGIIPRAVEDIFAHITAAPSRGRTKYLVRASYVQIYNEVLSDLLLAPGTSGSGGGGGAGSSSPRGSSLAIRHTPQRGVFVEGLSEWIVRHPEDAYQLIERGTAQRATSSTRMSELSSRSHAIFTLVVEAMEEGEDGGTAYRMGKLNVVDLAGSEKVRLSGVTGQRLEETKNINRSLHELGNVIAALAAGPPSGGGGGGSSAARHIPFRNSSLTSVLRDSLGGNCRTTLVACISPALEAYAESLSTLQFANRAKNIRNTAVVNEDVDQATLLRRYQRELRRLQALLDERGAAVSSDEMVRQMETIRRQAAEEKAAALAALERTSHAHQQELHARRELEERIRALEQSLAAEDLSVRLDERERERVALAEDLAQVDRYKELLLKQRDIMLSLTERLNERDETILRLQEEVDAYDAHVQALEDQLGGAAVVLRPPGDGASASGGNSGRPAVVYQAAAPMSAAQAAAYVQAARLPGGGYRSELQPAAGRLSSEEKMAELLQLRGLDAAPERAAPPSSAGGGGEWLSEAERVGLRASLQSRAEAVGRRRYAAALRQERQRRAELEAQLEVAHGRVQLLVRSHSAGERGAALAEAAEEAAAARYGQRTAALEAQLAAERRERLRLADEVDRLRHEAEQLLRARTDGQRAAASRLWRALNALEAPLLQLSLPMDAAAEGDEGRPTLPDGPPVVASPVGDENGARSEEEVVTLRRALATHEKDRRALQTILEQRIKAKVDLLCSALHERQDGASGGSGGDGERRQLLLEKESRSLQNLVNASIKAMSG